MALCGYNGLVGFWGWFCWSFQFYVFPGDGLFVFGFFVLRSCLFFGKIWILGLFAGIVFGVDMGGFQGVTVARVCWAQKTNVIELCLVECIKD